MKKCQKVDNDSEHNQHFRKKTEKYELIAKSNDFLFVSEADPTQGDFNTFDIRRRIRPYVKNGPEEKIAQNRKF